MVLATEKTWTDGFSSPNVDLLLVVGAGVKPTGEGLLEGLYSDELGPESSESVVEASEDERSYLILTGAEI